MGSAIDAGTQMGAVALVVADLARSLDYYQRRIGLSLLERSDGRARLGVGERELLWLQEQPGARPFPSGHTGLYHYALLMPSRAALGRVLQHLLDTQTPVGGASDHGVSEALYLTDPDGHGIEIYRDRRRAEWPVAQGQLQMVLDPLDGPGILAAGRGEAWRGMEEGTTMGHVHLHVAQLAAAESFYVDLVGFELMQRFGGQASFISAGGYHHHLGLNVWAGVGAPPAPADAARLLWYEVRLPDAAALDAVLARLRAGQVAPEPQARGWLVHDPAQNALILRT
jgi:catechol 2,3-dioxygenase